MVKFDEYCRSPFRILSICQLYSIWNCLESRCTGTDTDRHTISNFTIYRIYSLLMFSIPFIYRHVFKGLSSYARMWLGRNFVAVQTISAQNQICTYTGISTCTFVWCRLYYRMNKLLPHSHQISPLCCIIIEESGVFWMCILEPRMVLNMFWHMMIPIMYGFSEIEQKNQRKACSRRMKLRLVRRISRLYRISYRP